MNNYIRNLYRLANLYTKGGPKKKNGQTNVPTIQPVDLYGELRKELDTKSYTQSDKTRTLDKVAQAEMKVEADKAEQKAREEELYRKTHTELKPMNQNSMDYASTNPATQQMAEIAKLNEANPQTIYRPDMYYQGQYFSPETREQSKRDMGQYGMLLIGAADPMFALYALGSGANELFTDDPNAREAVEQGLAWAPWVRTTNFLKDKSRKAANWVLKRTEKNLEKNIENPVGQIMQQHRTELERSVINNNTTQSTYSDWLAGSAENAQKWFDLNVGKTSGIPYRMTRKAVEQKTADRIANRSRFFGNFGRGKFSSDVFVPKAIIDDATFYRQTAPNTFKQVKNNKTFNNVKYASKGFKNSVGIDANPKDYYRVNLNELMQMRSNAFRNPELRYVLDNQMQLAKNPAATNVGRLDIYYNPNTIRFGTHFWPIGYGNVSKDVPTWSKIRRGLSSDLGIAGDFLLGAGAVNLGINAAQNKQFLHSGDYTPEDIVGMDWYNTLSVEDQKALDDFFSEYKLYPTDKKLKEQLQFIDNFYNDDENIKGYEAYKARRLR